MSHKLYSDAKTGKASVFVVGEPAWHKLGKTLSSAATAEEAIKEAGLDYEVKIVRNFAQVSDAHLAEAKSYSTVRTDIGAVLGSKLGNRYRVLQNVDAFKFFDAIVERKEAIYHSAGVLGHGERIWIMAKLPEYISIRGLDNLEVFITLFTSHDGSSGVASFIHVDRIVCHNTLQAAMSSALRRINYRHTGNIVQQISNGAELMGVHNMLKDELAKAFDHMTTRRVNGDTIAAFLNKLFPEPPTTDKVAVRKPVYQKSREAVLEAFTEAAGQDMITAKGTGFGLYNAVTYYIDNMKWREGKENAQLRSSWFGSDAALRQRAFDLVMAL